MFTYKIYLNGEFVEKTTSKSQSELLEASYSVFGKVHIKRSVNTPPSVNSIRVNGAITLMALLFCSISLAQHTCKFDYCEKTGKTSFESYASTEFYKVWDQLHWENPNLYEDELLELVEAEVSFDPEGGHGTSDVFVINGSEFPVFEDVAGSGVFHLVLETKLGNVKLYICDWKYVTVSRQEYYAMTGVISKNNEATYITGDLQSYKGTTPYKYGADDYHN